ncbi:MAG: rhomboid family intramembrane serine protease [Gammaproteobacteria bacterium]|nr:rhomboid family intramembrane serine protease [Gammaproteobacteria bacterium]
MIPLQDDHRATSRAYVTMTLIGVCCAVFLWQNSLDALAARRAVDALGAIPAVIFGDARLPGDLQWVPRFAPVLTSMFMHANWMHLLGNLLFLWIFGGNVEDAMGHVRYAAFYLLSGVVAFAAQGLATPHSAYPIIGASGAISGVLGAYFVMFPRARVLTLVVLPFFVTTVRLPAMLLLLLWFVVQIVSHFADHGEGVAFIAHIGGFIAGVALGPSFRRGDGSAGAMC